MLKRTLIFPFSLFTVLLCILASFLGVEASHENASAHLVPKHERETLIVTGYGKISAINVTDGTRGPYQLQFITLEPNSIFLPVLLHADMVFYVHTGSGTLSWGYDDDDEIKNVNIRKGDIYRLRTGSIFYVQSSLEPEGEKLRINAIFSNTEDSINEPSMGTYSSINDLVHGFDSKVLQAAFKVPGDVIEEILKASKPPAIIHALPKKISIEWQARLLKAFIGSNMDGFDSINGKKKKKAKAYNVLEADPDFKNCYGWSLTVDKHDTRLLKDSTIGAFMVNLTKGSMMGPHWNPRDLEIAIVLKGEGMIRMACSGNANESECKSLRFRVKEGDAFTVPRFHPIAQMSFNNDSFVFMGFTTSAKRNYRQFLAGKSSVLGMLDRQILALSFNVTNTTIDQLLTQQNESVILDCTSCAEEEERIMEEEIERKRKEDEEEERRQKEKERREEARKEQEEEWRREEEEERKLQEEKEQGEEKELEKPKRREEEETGQQEESRKQEAAAAMEQEQTKRQEKKRQKRAEQEQEAKRKKKQRGQLKKREIEGDNEGKKRVPKKI